MSDGNFELDFDEGLAWFCRLIRQQVVIRRCGAVAGI